MNTFVNPKYQYEFDSDSEEEQSCSDTEKEFFHSQQPIHQVMKPLFIAKLNFPNSDADESDF